MACAACWLFLSNYAALVLFIAASLPLERSNCLKPTSKQATSRITFFFFALLSRTTLNYFHEILGRGMRRGKGVFVLFLLTNQDNLKVGCEEACCRLQISKWLREFFVEKEEYGGQEYSVLKQGDSVW